LEIKINFHALIILFVGFSWIEKNIAESNDLVKLWNISRSPNQASSNKELSIFLSL